MKINNKIILLSIFVIFVSCESNNPTEAIDYSLSEHISSTHFEYYFSKGDNSKIDTVWQENYYNWLVSQLNVKLEHKLEFYKYRNREHILRVTGIRTNGFAVPGTYRFNTIWNIDNHESIHTVVMQTIGHPPSLFNEGIAVAFQALLVNRKYVP